MNNNFIIWGSSGHAKVLAELIYENGGKVIALFDNDPNAISVINGVPLYVSAAGFNNWLGQQDNIENVYGVAAIGGARGIDRISVHKLFQSSGIKVGSVISCASSVSPTASLGEGVQILPKSIIAAEASLGTACIVNHGASIDHECVIGEGVHLAPGVTLCGCVEVGDNVLIGAGSVVLPRVKIGSNSIIGAGSVVTDDIPSGVIAYGNPAKVIRNA